MIHIEELKNKQYDLSEMTQRIFSHSYLKPFSPQSSQSHREVDPKHFEITDHRIARCTHGAMHASRVVAFVKVIHLFRQDQRDPAINALANLSKEHGLTLIQLINLTQIAALFHDVAREDEGIDHWDKESAQACANFLKTEVDGLSDLMIELISNTIQYKDNKQGFFDTAIALGLNPEQAIAADYLRQLIHDADCLDVMRVRKTFKMQFLDMVTSPDLQHVKEKMKGFVREARALIHRQGDLYFDCVIKLKDETIDEEKSNFDASLKYTYESSENVYNKITRDMKDYPHLSRIERPLQQENESAYYPFNQSLIEAIKQAFITATIVSEPIESSYPDKKDYLYIQFSTPIITSFTNEEQPSERDVVAIIYSGDAELTKYCNKALKPLGGLAEIGFRWVGSFHEKKYVEISGFSLKIIYPSNKFILREHVLNLIFSEIEKTSFITNHIEYSHCLQSMLSSRTEREHFSLAARSSFFTPSRSSVVAPHQLETVRRFIAEHIPPVSALYVRSNELNINPTYQSADQITRKLEINQKKIWEALKPKAYNLACPPSQSAPFALCLQPQKYTVPSFSAV